EARATLETSPRRNPKATGWVRADRRHVRGARRQTHRASERAEPETVHRRDREAPTRERHEAIRVHVAEGRVERLRDEPLRIEPKRRQARAVGAGEEMPFRVRERRDPIVRERPEHDRGATERSPSAREGRRRAEKESARGAGEELTADLGERPHRPKIRP